MFLFRLSESTLSLLQPSVNIFRTECLPGRSVNAWATFDLFPLPFFFKTFASSFQTFLCLIKLFVVDNAFGIFAFFKSFLASSFCLRNSLSKQT